MALTSFASPTHIFYGLLLCVVGRALVRAFLTPLRSVPGPTLAKFTRLWRFSQCVGSGFERKLIQLHREFGPLVRIAPNECSVNDPESIKIIHGPGSKFCKGPWYSTAAPGVKPDKYADLFTETEPKVHAMLRRKTGQLYTLSSLIQFEPFVDECTSLLCHHFSEFAASGKIIDLGHWLQCYAFDVIGHITYGKRFGFLDAGHDIGSIMVRIDGFQKYGQLVGNYPEWHPYIMRWLDVFAHKGSGLEYIEKFVEQIAQERANTPPDLKDQQSRGDFFSMLLQMHSERPENITVHDIEMVCRDNVGAGSDTTGITLAAVIYHLSRHPSTLIKVRAELDGFEADGKMSGPVPYSEAQRLPFLQAVIKETLRMHPAAAFQLQRVVPQGGVTLSGHYLQEGTLVGANCWAAHTNKEIFGPDTDEFRPERWLEADDGTRRRMESAYIPFGFGSRTCIGRNISLMEISKAIPPLIRDFDFDFVLPEDWTTTTVGFVKFKGLNCRIKSRNRSF